MTKRTQAMPSTTKTIAPPKDNSIKYFRICLVLLVLVIYGQSLNFEFTLDDDLFYLKHQSVQQGISAISDIFRFGSLHKFDGTVGLQPYRPITLLALRVFLVFFAFDYFDYSFSPKILFTALLSMDLIRSCCC
jgi:hypothetical protein